MRIGIVTGEYPPMQGGLGAYTSILAAHLTTLGHTVRICTRILAGQQPPNDVEVPVDRLIHRWNWDSFTQIRTWTQQHALEVVNLQFQTAAYQMSPWIHFLPDSLRPLPLVTTFHDLRVPYLFPKAGKLRDWIVMRLAQQSTCIIVTNHEDDQRLRNLPFRALIPIGSNILEESDTFEVSSWRQQAGTNPEDFLIAYFGLANHTKGIDTLIAALSRLRSEGIPAKLVMIGSVAGSSDPTNRAFSIQLEQIITGSGMTPYIHQTGYVPDSEVGAYLRAADVVALPFRDGASFRRGSLMAPIHFGCAIVTTTPQVLIPEFKDGENLILVPPDDVPVLTEALQKLFESPALQDRLRTGAKNLASIFDWNRIAQRTADFFAQVIQ
jgi:glycosyltransferase involved in cell wall biosynthesis